MKRVWRILLTAGFAAAFLALAPAARTEPDIRRDAIVQAVEQVMPCVVNVATETLVVAKVAPGSPAADAALRKYCIINGIGGRRVRNGLDIFAVISQVESGGVTEISFLLPRTRGQIILGYQEEVTEVKLR